MLSHPRFRSQIPRERQSSGLLHLLVPLQGFFQLRDVKSPSPITRDHPQCIPRKFQGARPFQGAGGERIRWTQATSKRRAETLRSAESHVGLAHGVLHGGSKGFKLVDGPSTSIEFDALRPDVEIRDKRVDSTSRDGTEGNTSSRLRSFQPCRLFLDGLSLPPL